MTTKLCRHYHTWLIAGGFYEWCYECGALRRMKPVKPGVITSATQWKRPEGRGGKNTDLKEIKRK